MDNLSSLLARNYSIEDKALYDKFVSEHDYEWEQLNELTDCREEKFGLEKLYAFCALDGIKIKSVDVTGDSNRTRTNICFEYKWIPSDGSVPRWDTGFLYLYSENEAQVIAEVISTVHSIRFFLNGKNVNEL